MAPLVRIAVAGGSLVIFAVAFGVPGDGTAGALSVWLSAVLLATIAVIVRRLLHHRAVALQTIYGALSAYLLIGFLFTALYSAVVHLGSEQFFAGGEPATSASLQYFSFITMTTTGYGDLTPLGNGPRSLAVLEALSGQIFLVTLVARLVAMFGQLRPGPRSDPAEAETVGPAVRSRVSLRILCRPPFTLSPVDGARRGVSPRPRAARSGSSGFSGSSGSSGADDATPVAPS